MLKELFILFVVVIGLVTVLSYFDITTVDSIGTQFTGIGTKIVNFIVWVITGIAKGIIGLVK